MNLCCIFNYPPLYRESIYKKIDEEFNAKFYFGDLNIDIAKIDESLFSKKTGNFHIYKIRSFEFYRLIWRLPFLKYDNFLVSGTQSLSYIPFIIICHLLGKKVYGWGHGAKKLPAKFSFITKWFLKNWDGYFTYGEGGKQRLIQLGFSANKVHTLYNSLNEGVDINNRNFKSNILLDKK